MTSDKKKKGLNPSPDKSKCGAIGPRTNERGSDGNLRDPLAPPAGRYLDNFKETRVVAAASKKYTRRVTKIKDIGDSLKLDALAYWTFAKPVGQATLTCSGTIFGQTGKICSGTAVVKPGLKELMRKLAKKKDSACGESRVRYLDPYFFDLVANLNLLDIDFGVDRTPKICSGTAIFKHAFKNVEFPSLPFVGFCFTCI